MDVYLINLDRDEERLSKATAELSKIGLVFRRVSGFVVTSETNVANFVTNSVAGCWLAHRQVFEMICHANQPGLILEDDIQVGKAYKKINEILDKADPGNFDMLQMGFVELALSESVMRKFRDAIKITEQGLASRINRMHFPFLHSIKRRVRFIEAMNAHKFGKSLGSIKVISDSFLPGTHAYLVTPKIAREILKLNQPIFLSADQFFMSLASMRSFRCFRVSRSLINQDLAFTSNIGRNRYKRFN
jgi:GR25 family glycosyltransferase involved in LPS biosynthesis